MRVPKVDFDTYQTITKGFVLERRYTNHEYGKDMEQLTTMYNNGIIKFDQFAKFCRRVDAQFSYGWSCLWCTRTVEEAKSRAQYNDRILEAYFSPNLTLPEMDYSLVEYGLSHYRNYNG